MMKCIPIPRRINATNPIIIGFQNELGSIGEKAGEKWLDVVKDNLKSGDEKQYTWEGSLENKYGHLVLSKKKVLFVEEHGFVNKTAKLMLNDSYNNISKVEASAGQMTIVDSNGAMHTIKLEYSNSVLAKLEELRKKAV